MNINSIGNVDDLKNIDNNIVTESGVNKSNGTAFQNLLDSAMNMIDETNSLQKDAQQAAINYEMGYSNDTNSLAIAQKRQVCHYSIQLQ